MRGSELHARLQLRRTDMDVLAHLGHMVYGELFFEARQRLMSGLSTKPGRFVVARSELDYLHEIRYEDGHVDVVVRIAEMGRKSATLEHELLLPDGTLAARNRVVIVAWDTEGRCSRELTPQERAALAERAS